MYLTNETTATIGWSGFAEPCAGVREYEVHVAEVKEGGVWALGG